MAKFTALNEIDEKTLYHLIVSDDLTYEGIIREIVREQNMDPWNIDVSVITSRYLQFIKKLKKIDFRISGKILLTAAILLKMKSDLLQLKEEKIIEDEDAVSPWDKETVRRIREQFGLIKMDEVFAPKLPLPRKRALTLDDLLNALNQAMDVKYRRDIRYSERRKEKMSLKIKKIDILSKIKGLYDKIGTFFKVKTKIELKEVIPSKEKMDIIWTLIPLLHLANEGKVDLEQEEDFGDIFIIKGYKFGDKIEGQKETG
jgi:segregation and condensation protein A